MQRATKPSRRSETLILLACALTSLALLVLPDAVQIFVADRLGSVITAPWTRTRDFAEDVVRLRRHNEQLLAEHAGREMTAAGDERGPIVLEAPAPADSMLNDIVGPLLPCQVDSRKIGRFVTMIRITSAYPADMRPYQPVMSRRGLIGRVRQVTGARTAWVELLNRPGFAVGCEIQRTGLLGVLQSRGDDFQLAMVGRDEDVREGDRVYTSGMAEIGEDGYSAEGRDLMPRGLPVGIVTRVAMPADELFKSVRVQPLASFTHNEVVFVVGAAPRRTGETEVRP